MKNSPVILLLLVLSLPIASLLLLQGCGKKEKENENASSRSMWDNAQARGADASADEGPDDRQGNVMRFRTEVCIDKAGTGGEAFRMLVPAGWKFASGVTWVLDNPGMPATAWFRVTHPSRPVELELFPNQAFYWTDHPLIRQTNPPGSRYFGAEVRPPLTPVQALKSIVLGRFRRSARDLSVISEEHLPDLAASLGVEQKQGMTNDGGKIRVRYAKDGTIVEEELYALVETLLLPVQSAFGTFTSRFWTVSYIFSAKAPQGDLDKHGPLFQTMGASVRVNPKWMNTYVQVVNYLIQAQIRHIRSVGELSRIISRTHQEISDENMRSWEARQGVYDRLSERFSQNIRSVDEYYDPVTERRVELPAGYENAWVNGLGEYVISEQQDYNPNIGSNQNWQRMERSDK